MRRGANADRAAAETLDDGHQELAVNFVEAELVDLEHLQSVPGDGDVDLPFALDLGEVAYAAQEAMAMRGVPRERRAISCEPSVVTSMFRI